MHRRTPEGRSVSATGRMGVALLTVWIAVASPGCVTYRSEPLEGRPASSVPERTKVRDRDVYIDAKLLNDPATVRRYLGRNVLDWNVLPIEISIETRQDRFQYEIQPSDVRFVLLDETEFEQVRPARVASMASWSGWRSAIWWLFLIVPGWLVLDSVGDANQDMRAAYEELGLRGTILVDDPARSSTNGILFFKPPKGPLSRYDIEEGGLEFRITEYAETAEEQGSVLDVRVNVRTGR